MKMTAGEYPDFGFLMEPLPLLCFRTQDVDFALDARRVEKILDTRLVKQVEEEGVPAGNFAFFRNAAIPVIDLRSRFRWDRAAGPCPLIVLSLRQQLVGVIVEQVGEVRNVPALDIEPVQLDDTSSADYVDGIINDTQGKLLVVDMEKLLYPVEQ